MIEYSKHASERILEMGLADSEIIDALLTPDVTYPTWGKPHQATYVRGRLALGVGFDRGHPVVLTVLWHTPDRYERPAKDPA